MDEFEALKYVLGFVPEGIRRSLEKIPVSEQFKDKDGYYKKRLFDGSLAVQNVDENGKPIKKGYIGGTTKESRDKFWKQSPIIRHAVDSIANEYKINPKILKDRLNDEGFVDNSIRIQNQDVYYSKLNKNAGNIDAANEQLEQYKGYDLLNSNATHRTGGFAWYGLDDVADFIEQGKVNLINENWSDSYNINEHGRNVHSADGETVADNLGLVAATLKYMRDKAAKDFPKASRKFLDEAAGIYYNRGESGGKTYMKNKK